MSHQKSTSANSPGTPEALLAEVDALRRRTRASRHAYWLPLLLFGLLTVLAAPLYVESADPTDGPWPADPGLAGLGGGSLLHATALGWYWLVALIGGYLLSLGWYRRHALRVGVQGPIRGYLIAGALGTVVGLSLPVVLRYLLLNAHTPIANATEWFAAPLLGVSYRGMVPHLVIALGLVVLAWLERSRGLSVIAVSYAAAVILVNVYLNTANLEPGDLNNYSFMLAALVPTPILLVGGVAALVQARKKTV